MPNGRSRQAGNGRKRNGNGQRSRAAVAEIRGLKVPRLFTTPGTHPYDEIEWEHRKAQIVAASGKVSFEQDGVEFPKAWSQNATNIVAEKYFRGKLGTPNREWSVRQIIDRVVDSITAWGAEQGRFAADGDRDAFEAELKHILVTQKASFNSPVWFNIGVPGRAQQASACQPYDALVSTPEGQPEIGRLVEENAVGAKVYDSFGITKIVAVKKNGRKHVRTFLMPDGNTLHFTADHLVWRVTFGDEGEWVEAGSLRRGDRLLWCHPDAQWPQAFAIADIRDRGVEDVYDIQTESGEYLSCGFRVHNCFILHVDDSIESIAEWYRDEMFIFQGGSGSGLNVSNLRSSYEHISPGGYSSGPVTFMRGADASAGTIKSGGATRRAAKMVVFNVDHPDLLELKDGSPGFVWCKAVEERKARALKAAGFDMSVDSGIDAYSIQYQNANNSVRVTDEFMQAYLEGRDWHLRAVTTGDVIHKYEARDIMRQIAQAAWECADPGMQYHTTTNDWHTCPAAGPITASNPCAEFVHLDNSPCNLASLNLLRFLRPEGTFDTESFEHAVSIVLLGQAILCVAADYPTEKITKNARGFRELGVGYANLGALLMALGVPYESDEGRAWAAAITSLMQGASYRASARFAEVVGPYPGTDELPGFAHPENREATVRVLRKHAAFSRAIGRLPTDVDRTLDKRLDVFHAQVVGSGRPVSTDDELARVVDHANDVWQETLELAERFGVENSQVSVLAPTGTISFMLDCDTTGIEPDLALKKIKKLVGGGTMSIVNQTVPRALRRLGYNEEQVEAIVAYIDDHNTVVDAPALRPEHYAVFACSFTTDNLIGHMGHVKMVAAAQPFLSGSASKTINVPEFATVEDMEEILVEGWRLGLKAIAMYRDNCKADQPLSAETKKAVEEAIGVPAGPVKRRMPSKHPSFTYRFRIADCKGWVHVGLYPETQEPGEIFVNVAKQGSTLAGVMDAFAISISMGLQYGVPLEAYVEKFMNMTFEPQGITDDPDIRFAKSLMDFIFRRLAIDFLPVERREALGIRTTSEREGELNGIEATIELVSEQEVDDPGPRSTAELVSRPAIDAPLCSNCGIRMRPSGSCFACESCGATSGCS